MTWLLYGFILKGCLKLTFIVEWVGEVRVQVLNETTDTMVEWMDLNGWIPKKWLHYMKNTTLMNNAEVFKILQPPLAALWSLNVRIDSRCAKIVFVCKTNGNVPNKAQLGEFQMRFSLPCVLSLIILLSYCEALIFLHGVNCGSFSLPSLWPSWRGCR